VIFFHVLIIWNVRPAGDSNIDGKADVVVDDDDDVELEKSNILLMGPTGSGKRVFTIFTLEFIAYLWFCVDIFQCKILICDAFLFESRIVLMNSVGCQRPSFVQLH